MIPKKIHRIWLGSEIPASHERIWEIWRDTFPDYELNTWTEVELSRLGMPKYFHYAQTYAERSDIARIRVLNVYGGIYADCDVKPLARFDHLWTAHDKVIAFEERPGLICNGLFAAGPSTLTFLAEFVERNSHRNAADAAPNVRTGPFAFTAAIDYLLFADPTGVRVYPPSFLDLDGTCRTAVASTRLQDTPIWRKAFMTHETERPPSTIRDLLFDLRVLPLRMRRFIRRVYGRIGEKRAK